MAGFIESLQPAGILSFAPGIEPVTLRSLNVLIGPNGSGKSNFIEILELLRAAPTDLAGAVRDGGVVSEWLWKGATPNNSGKLEALIHIPGNRGEPRYRLEFGLASQRLEVLDEAIEDASKSKASAPDVRFYYRFQRGHPVMNTRPPGPSRWHGGVPWLSEANCRREEYLDRRGAVRRTSKGV